LVFRLTRSFPFPGRTFQEILRNNLTCTINFTSYKWQEVSVSAKKLVKGMIAAYSPERLTSVQIAQDPWFLYNATQKDTGVIENEKRKLKASIM
jgi:hypothetical protein